MTRAPNRSKQRYLLDGHGAVRLDWTTQAEGDSGEVAPETFLVMRNSVFHRDDPSAPWRLLSGERAELARMQTVAGVPWELVRDRRFADAKLIPARPAAGARVIAEDDFDAIEHFKATLGARGNLGDSPAPRSIQMTLHERDHQWALEQFRVSYRDDADSVALLARPSSFEPSHRACGPPVRDLLTRPWTIAPDRLARASQSRSRVPEIRTFTDRFELTDSTQRLVAVDIGARSDHTDEFVVFSFPPAGLLFEAEQGWVTVGGMLRASRRAEGFLGALDAEKIAVHRLVQASPMRGEPREQARAQLEELISKRKK